MLHDLFIGVRFGSFLARQEACDDGTPLGEHRRQHVEGSKAFISYLL